MGFSRYNQRTFYRHLFARLDMQTVTLLKRNNDQQQGTVTAYTMYGCWPSIMNKTGESLEGEMETDHTIMWNIPRTELQRIGVAYINNLDRIQGTITNGIWQPESLTNIDVKLMECYLNVFCLRVEN